jgi:hypothetical protein
MRWEAAVSGEETRKNPKPATVAIAPSGRKTAMSSVVAPILPQTTPARARLSPASSAGKPAAGPAVASARITAAAR